MAMMAATVEKKIRQAPTSPNKTQSDTDDTDKADKGKRSGAVCNQPRYRYIPKLTWCRMGSRKWRNDTCPRQRWHPPNPGKSQLVLDLATSVGCKAELTLRYWGGIRGRRRYGTNYFVFCITCLFYRCPISLEFPRTRSPLCFHARLLQDWLCLHHI